MRTARAIALALLLAAAAMGHAPTSEAVTTPIKVMTFNACGAMPTPCPKGEYVKFATAVADKVRRQGIDVAGFQEVCAAQAYAVRDRLNRLYPGQYQVTFTTNTLRGYCDNHLSSTYRDRGYGMRAGIAVMVRTKSKFTRTVTPLPWQAAPVGTRGREPRSLLCVKTTIKARSVEACNTHISPMGDDRTIQGRMVLAKTKAKPNLILTMDGNFTSGSFLWREYRAAGLTTADRTGKLRTAHEWLSIDHIWTSGSVVRGAFDYPLAKSDHHAVEATIGI